MLYQILDGTVSLGGETILSHIDFEIKGKEKAAIVGRNGAGKTTLLRLIAGELALDRDDRRKTAGICRAGNITVGYLQQNMEADPKLTLDAWIMRQLPGDERFSREAMEYRAEYQKLLNGFGLGKADRKKTLECFSGGEQTKIRLIRLLLEKPDLLLLDEPTNHLDMKTVEWLEEYLRDYQGAVLLVSHDRFFLDRLVDVVYELDAGKLFRYPGNYTAFREQKQKNLELQRKAYARQQAEIRRLEDLIEKFKHKPNKAAFARSRKSILMRTERLASPREDDVHIFAGPIEPKHPGSKWVFEAEHLKVGYENVLFELSLRMRRGQKIGIIGDNGVGKSTLLKAAAGLLEPLDGSCVLGNHTLLGYFDQHSAELAGDMSVRDHFAALFPGMPEKELRQTLGAYLFGGAQAAKQVRDLSGGERARLVLCELLTAGPNFLVLDEPTNHMDIQAKETLESALRAYTGSILFVSHDRYFVSRVADAILLIENGRAKYYPFGYEHYIERARLTEDRGALMAMVDARNQAMVADLKAVPKPERHRLAEVGTEEAHADWKLGLAKEPLKRQRDYVEELWDSFAEIRTIEEYDSWRAAVEEENDRLTEECLRWYDVFLELGL